MKLFLTVALLSLFAMGNSFHISSKVIHGAEEVLKEAVKLALP